MKGLKWWGCVFIIMLTPFVLHGQADTANLLKRAKDAQKKFEQIHRSSLPTQFSANNDRPCDVVVGRICYWNDTAEVKQPEESAKITNARLALIDTLKTLNSQFSNDWIIGQLVFYQIQAGQKLLPPYVGGASTYWWKLALEGYIAHQAGGFAYAEELFAEALDSMPAKLRCQWTDLSLLIPKNQRKEYSKLSCDKRIQANEYIWLLADPLYSTHGNERKTAHYARRVVMMLQTASEQTSDTRWGKDIEEIWLRYGPPNYYTRSWMPSMEGNGRVITGRDAARNYHYFPIVIPFNENQIKESMQWDLNAQNAQEGYATPKAARISEISPQVAVFKRDTVMAAIAAVDGIPESYTTIELRSSGFDKRLVYATSYPFEGKQRPKYLPPLEMYNPWIPLMISVEAWDTGSKKAARYRTWWTPPPSVGGIQMSDILLYLPSDSASQISNVEMDLDGRIKMLSTPVIQGDGTLGLYWEVYGLDTIPTMNLPVSLSVSRVGDSGMQKFLGAIGLLRRHTPLTMKWNETSADTRDGIMKKSLLINLSNIPPGKYRLKVQIHTEAGTVSTNRNLEIR